MNDTLFYSWHSDLDEAKNRYWLRNALKAALNDSTDLEESLRYDEATLGVAGTPDIPATIFDKITHASVAVFDVTHVGKTEGDRPLQNPNVLLELGFASEAIGWDRIILVFNKGYGGKPEDLPFDLRHRRFPVVYDSESEESKGKFSKDIKKFIAVALAAKHHALERAKRRLTRDCGAIIDKFGQQSNFAFDELPHATDRLIDLGLIGYDVAPSKGLYSYHWSRLGQKLCEWFHEEKAKAEAEKGA